METINRGKYCAMLVMFLLSIFICMSYKISIRDSNREFLDDDYYLLRTLPIILRGMI